MSSEIMFEIVHDVELSDGSHLLDVRLTEEDYNILVQTYGTEDFEDQLSKDFNDYVRNIINEMKEELKNE